MAGNQRVGDRRGKRRRQAGHHHVHGRLLQRNANRRRLMLRPTPRPDRRPARPRTRALGTSESISTETDLGFNKRTGRFPEREPTRSTTTI